jgi:hypothetical protein
MTSKDVEEFQDLVRVIKMHTGDCEYACKTLTDLIKRYGILLKKAIEDKQVVMSEDVCCRTCSEWQPCTIYEEDASYAPPREESCTGLCTTHGNDVTHDIFTPWNFFCPDHPFFKQEL